MSFLDALTILGSGVGKGYKGSQEIQRQIAEAKRKALIDEQEQARADRQAALAERLGSSTIESQGLAREADRFTLGESQRRSIAAQAPITPSGRFSFDALGNNINLPGTSEGLGSLDTIINELLGNASRERMSANELNIRKNNPGAFGGGSREPTDIELAIKMAMDLTGPLTQLEALNPEKAAGGLKVRQDYLMSQLPALLAKIRALRNSGSLPSDTTATTTLSADEAYKAYLKTLEGK